MPDEEAYYSNPRLEMAPEDYAPEWDAYRDYDEYDDNPEEEEDDD